MSKVEVLQLLSELIGSATRTTYDEDDISGLNPRTTLDIEEFADAIARALADEVERENGIEDYKHRHRSKKS